MNREKAEVFVSDGKEIYCPNCHWKVKGEIPMKCPKCEQVFDTRRVPKNLNCYNTKCIYLDWCMGCIKELEVCKNRVTEVDYREQYGIQEEYNI